MSNPEAATPAHGGPILVFDGVCNLCNGAVDWILRRDRRGVFRFASMQSPNGRRLLSERAVPMDGETMVLLDGPRTLIRSSAALAVAGRLGWPWRLAAVGRLVPRPLRDAVYSAVARRRYRWFGRRDSCRIPEPEIRDRFLD